MNYERILICIFLMAGITYLIRMLPLTFFRKEIESNFVNSFFSYIPYAVLGAMTFPEVFYSTGNLISAVCGVIVAIFLSFKNKSMIIVSLSACGAVFITERFLELIKFL